MEAHLENILQAAGEIKLLSWNAIHRERFSLTPAGLYDELVRSAEKAIDIEEGAFHVHGITLDFLSDKPVFAGVVEQFMNFVGVDQMVIHNASDHGFQSRIEAHLT